MNGWKQVGRQADRTTDQEGGVSGPSTSDCQSVTAVVLWSWRHQALGRPRRVPAWASRGEGDTLIRCEHKAVV